MNTAVCKICKQEKTRIRLGDTKYFINETGNRWGGRICPPCNVLEISRYGTLRRLKEKEGDLKVEYSKRRCRTCNGKLTTDRYFNCTDCQPVLPDDSDWIYFDLEGEEYAQD